MSFVLREKSSLFYLSPCFTMSHHLNTLADVSAANTLGKVLVSLFFKQT